MEAYLSGLANVDTLRACRSDIAQFREFLSGQGVELLEARRWDVDAWLGHLRGLGRKESTVARKLSTLRGLYGYALAEEMIRRSPAASVTMPKIESFRPRRDGVLSKQDVLRLLEAADRLGSLHHALIALLFFTGARVSSLVGADVEDFELAAAEHGARLWVTVKGGRRVQLAVAGEAAVAVASYLSGRPAGPLLLNTAGVRMSRFIAWRLVRAVAAEAGIAEDSLHPHAFRHAAATLSLEAGASIRDTQQQLAHVDPKTTELYDALLREAAAKATTEGILGDAA